MEFDEDVFFVESNKWDNYIQDNLYVIPKDMIEDFKQDFDVLFVRQHLVNSSYYVVKAV